MIIVEQRLTEVFDQLPDIGGKKPSFHFGDDVEANKFIKGARHDVYPLIYQTSNNWDWVDRSGNDITTNLTLLLCVQNLNVDMYNSERWATSYRNVLIPLFELVDKSLKRSNIITSEYLWRIENYPNYSESESNKKNKFIDIVDAIQLNLRVSISDNCVNEINFNF